MLKKRVRLSNYKESIAKSATGEYINMIPVTYLCWSCGGTKTEYEPAPKPAVPSLEVWNIWPDCQDKRRQARENESLRKGKQPGASPQISANLKPIDTREELAKIAGVSHDKQGEWIEANIPEDGGKPAQNGRFTLADVGIERHDSPKFRILARIPGLFIGDGENESGELRDG